jgi:hypothetical protein
MKIITTGRTTYSLQNEDGCSTGSLIYQDDSLNEAILSCDKVYFIIKQSTGVWVTNENATDSNSALCEVKIGGTMSLVINNKQYVFRKPFNWKLRLVMLNADGEEVLAFLPTANWKTHAYNYGLQLNDEFKKETDSFHILQALHCAVCSMAMMNGFIPPIVVCST